MPGGSLPRAFPRPTSSAMAATGGERMGTSGRRTVSNQWRQVDSPSLSATALPSTLRLRRFLPRGDADGDAVLAETFVLTGASTFPGQCLAVGSQDDGSRRAASHARGDLERGERPELDGAAPSDRLAEESVERGPPPRKPLQTHEIGDRIHRGPW